MVLKSISLCPICFSEAKEYTNVHGLLWCGNTKCFVCTFKLATAKEPAEIVTTSYRANGITLIKEYPIFFKGTKTLGVYQTINEKSDYLKFRIHLALPVELISPIKDIFESLLGKKSWTTIDNHFVYWTVISQTVEESRTSNHLSMELYSENMYMHGLFGDALKIAKDRIESEKKGVQNGG
jgi:hypothetical protein